MARNSLWYDVQDEIAARATFERMAASIEPPLVRDVPALAQVTQHEAATFVAPVSYVMEGQQGGGDVHVRATRDARGGQRLAVLLDVARARGDRAAVAILEAKLGLA